MAYNSAFTGSQIDAAIEVISDKVDKKVPVSEGNFAALDAEGNLIDSKKKTTDFAPTDHDHTKAQITDFPDSMLPTEHMITHAKGGTDELGAEDISVPDLTASLYGLPDPTVNDLFGVLSGAAMVKKDVAQIGWFGETWQSTSPPLSQSRYMAYGKGLFVAIQRGGACATSPDGITWTQSGSLGSLPDKYWQSLTYGNGLFVAVADTNKCATSPDGITWTQRAFPLSVGSRAITYGGGLFVAVGATGNAVATSPDGINWTQRTLPASIQWSTVTYGDGLFFAVASNSGIAATSPDGINWTQRALPTSASPGWRAVAYGNGRFVACAEYVALGTVSLDEFKIDYAAADILGEITGGFTRIETGEYTGTGTSGAGNPNVLTAPFDAKILIIYSQYDITFITPNNEYVLSIGLTGNIGDIGTANARRLNYSWLGRLISWYGNTATVHLNNNGILYKYIFVG